MKRSFQNNLIEKVRHWYRKALRHSKYRWLVVFGSLLYLISPLDISPDVLPVIGWLDDGLIATLLITEVSQVLFEQLNASKTKQHRPEEEEEIDAGSTVVDVQAVSIG